MNNEELEIELIALRKIADKALAIIRADKKTTHTNGKAKKIDRVADITARILTGTLKPMNLKRKKAPRS